MKSLFLSVLTLVISISAKAQFADETSRIQFVQQFMGSLIQNKGLIKPSCQAVGSSVDIDYIARVVLPKGQFEALPPAQQEKFSKMTHDKITNDILSFLVQPKRFDVTFQKIDASKDVKTAATGALNMDCEGPCNYRSLKP